MEQDMQLDDPVTFEDVDHLFRLILRRPTNNSDYKKTISDSRVSRRKFTEALLSSDEFADKFLARRKLSAKAVQPDGALSHQLYRVPQELRGKRGAVRKVLLIGSCLMDSWEGFIAEYNHANGLNAATELLPFNNASRLPDQPAGFAGTVDFQVIQIPIRSVLPEQMYLGLKFNDAAAYQAVFEQACQRLRMNVDAALAYNRAFGITSFVLNFCTPQQNPMGRLQPRYALSNMVFFFEELNRELARLLEGFQSVHLVDFNEIVSTHGKRYFQDDTVSHLNHGSYVKPIGTTTVDEHRLEPLGDVRALFEPRVREYVCALYEEVLGMFRTIRQENSVKIVIFDLDDTLWRGVGAEADEVTPAMTEGWPLGVLEAASYLWRRGILVALVSKNDEANVQRIWQALYERRFPLHNFVARRINWRSKADNVAAILDSVNLLPGNALLVDDNPVERAAVKQHLPDIRVMDAPVAAWRRILLWAPELQRATITTESVGRTEMIQAQIERDDAKVSMGRDDFLRSLDLLLRTELIRDPGHPRFERCFELLNKTNQFNTTGQRWTPAEMRRHFDDGGFLLAFEVSDRFTEYGIVAVAVAEPPWVAQFVLSCRVFGMEVEIAAIARTVAEIRRTGAGQVIAPIVQTERNRLALSLFADCGFAETSPGRWVLPADEAPPSPGHIRTA